MAGMGGAISPVLRCRGAFSGLGMGRYCLICWLWYPGKRVDGSKRRAGRIGGNGLKPLGFRRFGNEKALFLGAGKGRWRRIRDSEQPHHSNNLHTIFIRAHSKRPRSHMKTPFRICIQENYRPQFRGLKSMSLIYTGLSAIIDVDFHEIARKWAFRTPTHEHTISPPIFDVFICEHPLHDSPLLW